jgi:hypothetical protein
MSQDLITQAEDFFKEKDEWYAFLDLEEHRDRIISNWFLKCKQELNKRFQNEEIDGAGSWLYVSWGNFSFRWYLKEFGIDSLCLLFENSNLHLSVNNGNIFDFEEITSLLQTKEYSPIVSAFERCDDIFAGNSWIKVIERGNFYFKDKYDGNFDNFRLAWYANYRTKELVDQIVRKVNAFRKDEKITELLREINEKAKKKS